ncbi:MAG: ABC transporter substrate-binding protein [Legionellales bacterium]|jgi:phospholipid transport system substrate-binding protein|nr:ABC transporter substrate-binding protein [Legionellales bacterium]NDH68149.1 ABC transporter substrate-binding protein [Gammaproteobacteria bacterium]
MIRIIKIVVLSFFAIFANQLAAQSSPVPMLKQTAQQIIGSLKNHQGALHHDPKIVHQAIRTYLLPHIDVEGMSRSVLGRQAWMKATSAERLAFEHEFTQLVIRTYAAPLAEYSGETVSFTPIRGNLDGRFVRVNSVIQRPNGQRIPLSYNLVSKADGWKVYDLSVEGVSLLQSFRTQFSNILQQGTMHDLLEQMRANKKLG